MDKTSKRAFEITKNVKESTADTLADVRSGGVVSQLKTENKRLQAELDWWHELIHKHHKNITCPDLKTYVENLQAENRALAEDLARMTANYQTHAEIGGKLQAENKRLKEALQWWIKINEGAPNKYEWAEQALKNRK